MSSFLLALTLACSNAPVPEAAHSAAAPGPTPTATVSTPPAGGGVAEGAGAPSAPSSNAAPNPVDSACLHKADLADGKEDKVAHNCTNCGLLMEGNATHASTHAGQTFHACSDTCKQAFDKEPDAVLARACAKP